MNWIFRQINKILQKKSIIALERRPFYLTKQEIRSISKKARSTIYSNQNMLFLTSKNNELNIFKVSPIKKLILIDGNEHFGFEHINNRHGYYSKQAHWQSLEKAPIDITNRKSPKLDYPSRFSKKAIPLDEYITISDEIYCKKNLNIENNHNPNILDLYIGKTSKNATNELKEYKLLVYKKSKIIHTLYPTDRKSKKKKRKGQFNFQRTDPKCSFTFALNDIILQMNVPYTNYHDVVRYIFIVRRYYEESNEKYYLQINEPRGKAAFTHLIGEKKHMYKFTQKYFENNTAYDEINNSNLKNIEDYIGRTEKNYFPNKK